jgi:hypothetical protein
VAPLSDANNCGTCGNVCGALETCSTGQCVCQAGLSNCAGSCVNTMTDKTNCGGCGTTCVGNKTCQGGLCK